MSEARLPIALSEARRGWISSPVQRMSSTPWWPINARLQITPGRTTTVSVPSPFGALILKAAAYQTDPRDKERHLQDAALLLSVIEDPYAEREHFAGSDRARLAALEKAMPDNARAWRALPADRQTDGQTALRILTG